MLARWILRPDPYHLDTPAGKLFCYKWARPLYLARKKTHTKPAGGGGRTRDAFAPDLKAGSVTTWIRQQQQLAEEPHGWCMLHCGCWCSNDVVIIFGGSADGPEVTFLFSFAASMEHDRALFALCSRGDPVATAHEVQALLALGANPSVNPRLRDSNETVTKRKYF
jgi:hypothetical protein